MKKAYLFFFLVTLVTCILSGGCVGTEKQWVGAPHQRGPPIEPNVSPVYGIGQGGNISYLNVTAVLAPGELPVNFDGVNVTYWTFNDTSNEFGIVDPLKRSDLNQIPASGSWAICQKINNQRTADNILDRYEAFIICVRPTVPIPPNQRFFVEIIPPKGCPLLIGRTTPPVITDRSYEVY